MQQSTLWNLVLLPLHPRTEEGRETMMTVSCMSWIAKSSKCSNISVTKDKWTQDQLTDGSRNCWYLNIPSPGRSYSIHQCCGDHLQAGDMIHLVYTFVLVNSNKEPATKSVEIVDGTETSSVAFIPRDWVGLKSLEKHWPFAIVKEKYEHQVPYLSGRRVINLLNSKHLFFKSYYLSTSVLRENVCQLQYKNTCHSKKRIIWSSSFNKTDAILVEVLLATTFAP